jgi:hypothetical protein
MNTTLTRDTRHEHPVHHEQRTRTAQVRRVGLVDRAALQLGVALITWSRRPANAPQHERRANALERALVRRKREARMLAERESTRLDYALMVRMR